MCKLRVLMAGLAVFLLPFGVAAESMRDPTRPLNYQVTDTQVTPPALNAILIGDGRKRAVINGKTLSEGDTSGSVTLLRIFPGKVVVRFQGQQQELQLNASMRSR